MSPTSISYIGKVIVMFKSGTPADVIDKAAEEVQANGRFSSSLVSVLLTFVRNSSLTNSSFMLIFCHLGDIVSFNIKVVASDTVTTPPSWDSLPLYPTTSTLLYLPTHSLMPSKPMVKSALLSSPSWVNAKFFLGCPDTCRYLYFSISVTQANDDDDDDDDNNKVAVKYHTHVSVHARFSHAALFASCMGIR
jgi:hypothetical protein